LERSEGRYTTHFISFLPFFISVLCACQLIWSFPGESPIDRTQVGQASKEIVPSRLVVQVGLRSGSRILVNRATALAGRRLRRYTTPLRIVSSHISQNRFPSLTINQSRGDDRVTRRLPPPGLLDEALPPHALFLCRCLVRFLFIILSYAAPAADVYGVADGRSTGGLWRINTLARLMPTAPHEH
jgi:hypothetical protein